MPHPAPPVPLDDPRLIAYLPMLYVAWADGDLEPEEMQALSARIRRAEGLESSTLELVGRWLDPHQPPAPQALQQLLGTIREAATELSAGERRSLADLGEELARRGGHTLGEAERQALAEIETALGIAGPEAARAFLAPERPSQEPEAPAPAFRIDALTRLLDGQHAPLRQELRQLLPRLLPPATEGRNADRDAYRDDVLAGCRELARRGYGGLSFPPETGGAGDLGAFLATFETLAFGDLSLLVKFGVQFGLFGGSILQLGTDKHHRRYLPQVGSLELPGCFAMTETGHGSNVADLETVAGYDPASQEWVLHTPNRAAWKDYIGNAANHGRMATVFAQLEVGGTTHGVHAFLVPLRDEDGRTLPGVQIEDCGEKMGLNGVDNGRLAFDQVRVPRENLLDRFATVTPDGTYESPIVSPAKRFFTMLGTLVGGRVSVALASLSAAKRGLAIAVRYGARRRQFGPAGGPEIVILDYPTHQRRLLPLLATTFALDFALKHLAERYVSSPPEERRDVETLAAGLKAFASWHATSTLQTCREACGGQGYLAVNRFAALKADTDVFTTFEGDNTVLLQLVAKGLLGGYGRRFEEMSWTGMVRYLAIQATSAVVERNPIVTRQSGEAHLRDRDFHRAAFRFREEHLLSTVARRMKRRLDDGMDSQQAVMECQTHLVATAKAHVERLILDRFAAALEHCEDPDLVAVLTPLCDLFALWHLERDLRWFLEHGYIESGKAKAIREQVDGLCREIRPQAVPLVDAWGVPEALLGPIAVQ